jgi:hypothetical protein
VRGEKDSVWVEMEMSVSSVVEFLSSLGVKMSPLRQNDDKNILAAQATLINDMTSKIDSLKDEIKKLRVERNQLLTKVDTLSLALPVKESIDFNGMEENISWCNLCESYTDHVGDVCQDCLEKAVK